ncbi:hypothetical protein VFPPC_11922 [Pochonia chlamydosporia 170]|uniref:Uncharacterized protein n=1 Tax=Pochonia chlamydosporia 170 TaxID=1380566 RepID=A0A179EYE1_METCM|nr:hypothetical protein VFPPC_11922 [Pochonia chlamydosporia 170]OAQ58201.1 hypothetical protein VFPPC_11922 [Pochonia chlamydosporia 170]
MPDNTDHVVDVADDGFEVESALLPFDSDQISNLRPSDSASQVSKVTSTSTTSSSSSKRKRTLRSDVWVYCREGREEDGELIQHKTGRYYYCKLCSAGYTNSEAAWSHLKSAYGIVKPEEASKRATTAANSPLKRSFAATALKMAAQKERVAQATMGDIINQERFNEALVRLIVMRNLPISAVEWPELEDLLKATNPAVDGQVLQSRGTLPKLIEKSFDTHRQILKTKLQRCPYKIHLAVDCWSSPNRKSLMAICAQFVDDGKLQKALIALPELQSHTGKETASAIIRTLNSYEILHLLGYIVSDNASGNDKMMRFVEESRGGAYKAEHYRIWCFGHILNLAAQAFLFAKDKSAVKCRTQRTGRCHVLASLPHPHLEAQSAAVDLDSHDASRIYLPWLAQTNYCEHSGRISSPGPSEPLKTPSWDIAGVGDTISPARRRERWSR